MIKLKNVSKTYGDKVILENINLHIKRGEIFGIIGLSGAGKSSLLRIINKLEDHSLGEVSIASDVKFGFIFQNFNLVNSLNVYDNVALSLLNENLSKEEERAKVNRVLKLVGLEQFALNKPLELSGGQKQRVGIARALVMDVNVLLCDEATSSLDPFTAKEIINLLLKLNQELGITVVFVSHQLEIVRNFCDRIATLDQGNICQCDTTLNLFSRPSAQITWDLLSSILGLDNVEDISDCGLITCIGNEQITTTIKNLHAQDIEIYAINQHHTKAGTFAHLFVPGDSDVNYEMRRIYEC